MLIDIIVHDAWVICMSKIVHIAFIIYVTWYRHEMTHRIAYAQGHRMKWVGVHGYNQHCVWYLIGVLNTVGQRPTGSYGCIHENEHMCQVIASRDRYPLG